MQHQMAEKNEWAKLEEMNEEEYDALLEVERNIIDQKRLLLKRLRVNKKKELKAKKEKEKLEKVLLEEKRKEDEKYFFVFIINTFLLQYSFFFSKLFLV